MRDYPGVSLTAAIHKVSVNDSFSDFLMYLPPADSEGPRNGFHLPSLPGTGMPRQRSLKEAGKILRAAVLSAAGVPVRPLKIL